MAGRFIRFLGIERPHAPADQQSPVVHPTRFAPEEPRPPGSGIETDEEPADAQPFLRCARCEADNTRFADRCTNCGAALHTPEQELYNRQLWTKRRAEAAAEQQALADLRAPKPPIDEARRQLGEQLALEVMQREEARIGWMQGGGFVPFGVRLVMAMPVRWRWGALAVVTLWLGGTGIAALQTHRSTPIALFLGSVFLLLALFSPSRPRRSRWWWSNGNWW